MPRFKANFNPARSVKAENILSDVDGLYREIVGYIQQSWIYAPVLFDVSSRGNSPRGSW